MRERSRQDNLKRLKQLEDAKKKIGANDPKVFDINNEIKDVNNKLKSVTDQNISNDALGEDILRETETQEPFGQDLDEFERRQEEEDQKREVARQILRNEPQKPEVPETGPRARASAEPAEDTSMESLKSPRQTLLDRAKNALNRSRSAGKPKLPGGGAGAAAKGEGAASTAGKAASQTGKLAAQAGKAIATGFARAVAWIIAGGWPVWVALAVILIAVAFVLGISYMGTISSTKPSTSGGTRLIAVDPKTDAAALQNLLKLSGEKSVTDQTINDALDKMKADLLTTKEDPAVKTNTALTKQIDSALSSLALLQGTKSLEASQNFLNQLKSMYNLMEGNIPVWQAAAGPTVSPSQEAITVFNSERHGNSFLINESVPNNNVYTTSSSGKCDAVDIGVTVGSNIMPIFGGKVAKDPDSDGKEGKKVIITSDDGKYTALYAHVQSPVKTGSDGKTTPLKKGDSLSVLEPLGAAFTNNVQIEVYYNNPDTKKSTCLVTNHADLIDHAMKNRSHEQWGGYLWDRIKRTFNLK